jgi:glycosyltransferase involved in cell wall biosynthesis
MAKRLIAQGQGRHRIRVIPNWADGEAIFPVAADANPFRAEHALDGRFVVMYSGNIGVGHELDTFAEAAMQLEHERPEVLFLFVGDGNRRAELERRVRGLGNVRFLPYQPRDRLSESLSAADVHLVSLRRGLEGLIVPSKLYAALAVGRPVLYVGPEGDQRTLISDEGVGSSVSPGQAKELALAIARYADDRELWRAAGERARRLLERCYERKGATRRWREVLQEAVR